MGEIITEDMGVLCPCTQEGCPHEQARVRYGETQFNDGVYEVWLRKLNDNGSGNE
jgi:hypothetical protein